VKTSRRTFVVATGASVAGALTGCGGGSSPSEPSGPPPTPPPITGEIRIPLMGVGQTTEASANLVGGVQTPLAVTRVSETQVVAVSRICTHMSCTVNMPARAGGTLDCPCHGSRFQTTGQVVNGPAARNLFQFPARIEGNQVVITPGV
jgi:Rieske Fe-S protein